MSPSSVPDIPPQNVTIPFLKKKVALSVDLDRHPVFELIAGWDSTLKKKLEDACFAHYRDKIASIGVNPSLPAIRKANEIWKHLEVHNARIDACVKDTVVIYVVPSWDTSEHMEWCIKGDKVVYVGQCLYYPVDCYASARSGNFAIAYE